MDNAENRTYSAMDNHEIVQLDGSHRAKVSKISPILGESLTKSLWHTQEMLHRFVDQIANETRQDGLILNPFRGKRHTTASQITQRTKHFKCMPVFKSSLHSTVV
jgi:hypothetical protein